MNVKDIRIKNIEDMHNNVFEIKENTFENLNQWVNTKCLKCGYEWKTKLSSLKYRGYCPSCRKRERLLKLKNEQYKFHYDRCLKLCKERNYIFYDVFKKNKVWYVKFDTNQTDRKGTPYGIVEQNELSFINDTYLKVQASDKVALKNNEFINKVQKIHPELDFSNTIYVNNHTSIKAICPKCGHGEFSVIPKEILKPKYKCAKCKKEEKIERRKIEVYNQMKKIHNGAYDYDMSKFKNLYSKIDMFCHKHGSFTQMVKSHLNGNGCPECGKESRIKKTSKTTEEFIKEAKEKRSDRNDDFSKVDYINERTHVTLICHEKDKYGREHGEYEITPNNYLAGYSCPKCSGRHKMNLLEFKEIANIVHNGKYDYDEVKEYNGIHSKVPIICHEKDELGREHGIFYQTVKHHLKGFGCKKCSHTYMDLELFKYRSNKIHNSKYIYDEIEEYVNNHTKIKIICPDHGPFYQTPMCHLQGQGCPYCRESHLEREVNIALTDNNIIPIREKRFEWLINDKTGYPLPLDFYIDKFKIAIECQGEQHYISNYYRSKGDDYADEHLTGVQYRDSIKKKLCKENNIHLIYYLNKIFVKYLQPDDIYFTDLNKLIDYIKNFKLEIMWC